MTSTQMPGQRQDCGLAEHIIGTIFVRVLDAIISRPPAGELRKRKKTTTERQM